MNDIFSLFHGVFSFLRTMSKNMYRNCAIIATGTVVIAVVSFNSNCYGGSGKNDVVVAYSNTVADEALDEDEDTVPETEVDKLASIEPLMADITRIAWGSHEEEEVEAETETEDIDTNEAGLVSADYIAPIISITDEDYNNLVRIVEAEATGLDVKAKILVANVVINRVFSKDFPSTVTEVIFQGNGEQFQPVQDGRFYSVSITDSSYEAVDRALVGEDYSEGALFFAATNSAGSGSWFSNHLKRLFEYNGHVFFGYR